jgi:alpha-D-xyloside xylohydrolase
MGWQKFLSMVILALFAQMSLAIEKRSDGIIISLDGKIASAPLKVSIRICSENIFRVVATPEADFSTRPSLIVDKAEWPPVKWELQEDGEYVWVTTSKLKAKVHRGNGTISFYDTGGNLILQEQASGGRVLTPAIIHGERTHHIQQIWDSPEDEAFYGLGQHQNNIWNYKGHSVDLFQHNIVASVPFLVSSRNYGILWDNYSRTKFGDKRDYQPLSEFELLDKDGNSGGLRAEYFKSNNFTEPLLTRLESEISHETLDDQRVGWPEGFNLNSGSVRWSGAIKAREAGVHTLRMYSSEYLKLWVNGELQVDDWRQNWLPWQKLVQVPMEAGRRYDIEIEWIPNGGYIGLNALPPYRDGNKKLSIYSNVGDQIDYYFICGSNLDDVIRGYRVLTGKAPMMPKWAMGFWQCRERYTTQEELLGVVREFRKRNIPLDNIVQDWFYWPEDEWGNHNFDLTRYPDAEAMVRQLHDELNTHIMISVWPKFYEGTENYEAFRERGWLYMKNIEAKARDWVGRGYFSTFYDPYSSGARELFWRQIDEKLFSRGFDAWWLDATEPDIHTNLPEPERIRRVGPTSLGSSARYENTYSLMNAKGIYEGQRQSDPDKRVFILTRSAFAGQQRYSTTTWSGDIVTRWHDFKAQLPAGLNMALSGIPYWTTDIGGFEVERRFQNAEGAELDEWREFNTRWFQYGTFCPIFRVHGRYPFREMFNLAPEDHPAYQTMLAYDKLRYRLMPYIYSLTGMITHEDYTIMRPLVMDFGDDLKTLNVGDQFMFGPAILVNPVTEYQVRSREVYLPGDSDWYELKSGKLHSGGRTITADAPYSDIPLFARAGSIIPFGPAIQYSDEKAADPIRLYVYGGDNGTFTLYEDENTNYNYETGAFSRIKFDYDDRRKELTIRDRHGEFPGMMQERTFEIVWVEKTMAKKLDFEARADKTILYNGRKITVKR